MLGRRCSSSRTMKGERGSVRGETRDCCPQKPKLTTQCGGLGRLGKGRVTCSGPRSTQAELRAQRPQEQMLRFRGSHCSVHTTSPETIGNGLVPELAGRKRTVSTVHAHFGMTFSYYSGSILLIINTAISEIPTQLGSGEKHTFQSRASDKNTCSPELFCPSISTFIRF